MLCRPAHDIVCFVLIISWEPDRMDETESVPWTSLLFPCFNQGA